MAEGRLPKIALKWTLKQKRARGRLKRNWIEGIRKTMNERNLNEGLWEDRKQWSLGVGQRRMTFWNRSIHTLFNNAVICWYYIISVLDEWMSIANWWNNDRETWMYLEKKQSFANSSTTNPTSTSPELNPGLRMKRPLTNHLRHSTGPIRKWNFSQLYTVFLPCPEIVLNPRKPDVPQKLISLQIENLFWHYNPWLTSASSKIVLHCSPSCTLCLQFLMPMLLRLSSTDWSHLSLGFTTCECLLA